MNPLLKSFDRITEIREYIFEYDDTESLTLLITESRNGLFMILLEGPQGGRVSLGAWEKRPSLSKVAKLARDQITLKKSGVSILQLNQ